MNSDGKRAINGKKITDEVQSTTAMTVVKESRATLRGVPGL